MVKKSDIIILLAGIMWGVLGVFVKELRQYGFTPLQISSLRWIFSAAVTFAAVIITNRKKLKIAIKDIWIFAFTGIFSLLAMTAFYFMSMAATSIAVSDILMYTAPIWVLVFSVIFFKERITVGKTLSTVLVFTGCVLVCGLIGSSEEAAFNPLGIVWGLCSGIAYSLYSIVGKTALKKYNRLTIVTYNFIFAAVGSLFIADIPQTFHHIAENLPAVKYILLTAVIGTVLPFFLYTSGLKHTPASKAAIMSSMDPISATVISIFAAKEKISGLQLIGIGLIISAILLLQLQKPKRNTLNQNAYSLK